MIDRAGKPAIARQESPERQRSPRFYSSGKRAIDEHYKQIVMG
ncbi:hypothetical protein [Janthinobacterium sp. GW458P]|nr:hypothetical protein [Janthinobacterium sp. GW458P]